MLNISNSGKLLIVLSFALFAVVIRGATAYAGEQMSNEAAKDETAASTATRNEDQGPKQMSQPIDLNPAALVNGVAISRKELDKSYNDFIQREGMDTSLITNPAQHKQAQLQVLNGLIGRELLWQEAKRKDFVAKDSDVESSMKVFKSRFSSESDFTLRLQQSGYTIEEYTELLKQQLSLRELVQKDIAAGITVSDNEVHDYYEANPDRFIAPKEVHARHILVKVDPGADDDTRSKAKKKIDGVLEEAKGGDDFGELAKKYSEGPTGPNGGDLGFFRRNQMVKPFAEAAFALEPGEISDVVQTIYGYHIIKAENFRGGDKMTEDEVREKLRDFLYDTKVQDAMQKKIAELRSEGTVEVLIGK